VNNLVEIKERNELIVKEITDLITNEPERRFLILSGRREHLNTIATMITAKIPSLEEEIGFYMGGMKKDELKISAEKSLIFATFEMASEGLDILELDTLFMITPKGSVNQAVGRILRKQADDYELPPMIVDIIDEIESLKRLAKIRTKLYKDRRYIINGDEPESEEEDEKPKIKETKVDFSKSLF